MDRSGVFKTILILIVFNSLGAYSQINKAEILKTYHSLDSTTSNKDAYLLLCKNNVFINYGIYTNALESEWYVWYASGTYELKDGILVCQSYSVINGQNQLIRDIKSSYKRRPDHVLIDSDYEFVCEKYKDRSFVTSGTRVADGKRKVEYFEIN